MSRIHAAVSAACPIVGVSVGTPGDSATVRVDYAPGSTAEQRDAADAVVAAFDWSDAAQAVWEQTQNIYGAAALLQSGDAVPRAVRASDSVGYELRNNIAEVVGVLIDHIDELAALPRADRAAAIIAWIAADRAAWEAGGGVWAETPPTPEAAYATGTDRVQGDELLPLVAAAVMNG